MWKSIILVAVAASAFTIITSSKSPYCRDANEVWDSCANAGCRRWNCSIQGILCLDPSECKAGCRCRDKYARNAKGVCIPEAECDQVPYCRDVNEVWDTCANGGCRRWNCSIQGILCISPSKCKAGCRCRDKYARNAKGVCIPEAECDQSPRCRPGERYEKCPDQLCEPLTCGQLGYPLKNCGNNPRCPGRPGCVCDYGRVRDYRGRCIPRNQCPSCGGDKNAVSGCGNHCGNTCTDYMKKDVVCPLYCLVNGCDCRPGYVYNKWIKKCVLPSQCWW